jgi:hypothetical protein
MPKYVTILPEPLRFMQYVDMGAGVDECWNWTRSCRPTGYGQFNSAGVNHYPHRYMWEMMIGPIPAGMTIDHLCWNKRCCNPKHMEVVTQSENSKRYWRTNPVRKRKHYVCQLDDCDRPHRSMGRCHRHYQQLLRERAKDAA